MKRARKILFHVIILSIISFAILFIYYRQNLTQLGSTNVANGFYKTHILGGFSIDTPERATKAATDGIQVVFKYGQPPSESDGLGQKLQSLHMKVVDGYVWALVYYYECHRTKELRPSLLGPGQYCEDDPYPNLADENALLAAVAAHLKQVKTNQLVIGYWVLDDWVQWDAGSARQLLIKIHKLIQQYTPGRSAICGFGANISSSGNAPGWSDWVAANFSPQGCDMVGFYLYTPEFPDTTPAPSPDVYDWSMSAVLPAMFASLQQRGWNIAKEPLIGIGQAFGGPMNQADHWLTPTAKDIEMQSRSFCEHGATGLTFYAWNGSGFGPATQTPMNSPEIERGIHNGITECKQYWSHHP
jgi:hypothetical protein